MAQRVVGLALGSMIQCFDWKRISDKEVDLAKGFEVTDKILFEAEKSV